MNGGLDACLGMPRYVLLHVLVSATDPTAWDDVLFVLGAYVAFLHPGLGQVALYVLLALMAALIFSSFVVMLGALIPAQPPRCFSWGCAGMRAAI